MENLELITNELNEIYDSNIKDEFLKAYRKAKTWADLDEIYQALSLENQRTLVNALETVKAFTGLDMRQDSLLSCMSSYLKYNS